MKELVLKINFYPDNDSVNLIEATEEYGVIWNEDGARIIDAIESIGGLKFVEREINAIVIEARSSSHPLTLRASLPEWKKRATLVHELCHRLVKGNRSLEKKQESLENHKEIDLILFDIWSELYGEDFAKKAVESENTPDYYKQAWDWALSFNAKERANRFKEVRDSW